MTAYDVLVVGAGSAGCHAATRLARAGHRVALLEQRVASAVGYAWVDSVEQAAFVRTGIAPPTGAEHAGQVDRLDMFTGTGFHAATVEPYRYHLTRRHPFAQRLIADALAAGVTLWDETPAEGVLLEGDRVVGVKTANGPIKAALSIDASGYARVLARRLAGAEPLATPQTIACYRESRQAPGPPAGCVEVVIGAHGYTWIVGDSAGEVDIGTGVLAGSERTPEAVFDSVVATRPELVGRTTFRGRGVVPLGLPPATLVHDGLVIVGDAAFQVLPTSGTGVGGSLVGAHLAADAALDAFALGKPFDRAGLWDYNVRFFHERGGAAAALDAVRRELQGFSEEDVAYLVARGVLPARVLAAGAHGEWLPPRPEELARAFARGAARVDLLLRLGIRLALAGAIARHCLAIPRVYGPERAAAWERELRRLTSTLG